MLSSIHPFGERSRNNRFWLTASSHVLGSTIGGLVLGAAVGVLAWASALVAPLGERLPATRSVATCSAGRSRPVF